MIDSQPHIKSLNDKIQALKACFSRGEMTFDALCHAIAIAGITEVERIYKETKEQQMDEQAKWIKENVEYMGRDNN